MHGTGNSPRLRLLTAAEVEQAMANVEQIERTKAAAVVEQLLAERDAAVHAAFQRGFDTATELTACRHLQPVA